MLREDGELFGTLLLSFVVIAQLWRTHHRIAEGVGSYDSAFVTINLVWLLTIVFLPFATQVAAVYGHQRLAVAVYLGTVTLSSLCLAALSLSIDRRPALSGGDTGRDGRGRPAGRRPASCSSSRWWPASPCRLSATRPRSCWCSAAPSSDCCSAASSGRGEVHRRCQPAAQ